MSNTPIVQINIHHCSAPDKAIRVAVKPHFLNEAHIMGDRLCLTFGSDEFTHVITSRYQQADVKDREGLDSYSLYAQMLKMSEASIEKAVAKLSAVNPNLPVRRTDIFGKDPDPQ